MGDVLLLKLHGPMQSWGEHSFEGLRPSASFPTRSALLGLLGACLGIRREEREKQRTLNAEVKLAVRVDRRQLPESERTLDMQKLTDYHTVKNARQDYSGLKSHNTIQTWREYLTDTEFTVAVWLADGDGSEYSIAKLADAVQKPHFTPYLGRRSCPLGRPLFAGIATNVKDEFEAFSEAAPAGGIIYTETRVEDRSLKTRSLKVRDVPLDGLPRQFGSRTLFEYGGRDVSE